MNNRLKFGFLTVIVLEIGVIFCLLRIHDRFVSDPGNYYENILTHRVQNEYPAE